MDGGKSREQHGGCNFKLTNQITISSEIIVSKLLDSDSTVWALGGNEKS